jgi:hypothetical protein
MEYQMILKRLSPCGLDCHRCADFSGGEIKRLSADLKEHLAGYQRVAGLKADHNHTFGAYPAFAEILELFSKAACGGCRADDVNCPITCDVKTCHKEREVDFCFQCADYPCESPLDPRLKERWKLRNDRMREIGVVEFYVEQSKLPRY